MKAVSQDYKNAIKEYGREIDSIITYTENGDTITLDVNSLNAVTPHFNGDILKSVMKQLNIDSKTNIPIGTEIIYQFGVKVNNEVVEDYRDNYEYITFSGFIVYSSEKREDTNSYEIICYDKMLYAMKNYRDFATYPLTIRDYINGLCTEIGLTFANSTDEFLNYDKTIYSEYYLDANGGSLDYTFRDVLDELAVATGSTIIVEDDDLILKYVDDNKNLPYKYKEVSYIEGKSFIQIPQPIYLDLSLSANTTITIKCNCSRSDTKIITFSGTGNYELKYSNNKLILSGTGGNVFTYNNTTDEATIKLSFTGSNMSVLYNDTQAYSGAIPTALKNYSHGLYIFGNSINNKLYYFKFESILYKVLLLPCYDIETKNVGLCDKEYINYPYQNYPLIETDYEASGGTNFQIETINEEYLKENSPSFGKTFEINSLSYITEENNSYNISIPRNLSDDLKNEITLSNNQFLNHGVSFTSIFYKIYGLNYTINDFQSTGITWLEICDRYNVELEITDEIGNTRTANYPCIMFNDEIDVTQGLQEHIYTDMPNQKDSEYNTLTKTQRELNRQNTINSQVEETINSNVLFEGDENSSVTLSENASNYTYFDIYYRSNDSADNVGFERVYNPNDKMVNLTYTWYQGVNCYVKSALFTISGTSMTSSQGIQYEFSSGGNINITQADNIYITRVEGYK